MMACNGKPKLGTIGGICNLSLKFPSVKKGGLCRKYTQECKTYYIITTIEKHTMAGNDNQRKYGLVEICHSINRERFLSNGKQDTRKWYYWLLDTYDISGLSFIFKAVMQVTQNVFRSSCS